MGLATAYELSVGNGEQEDLDRFRRQLDIGVIALEQAEQSPSAQLSVEHLGSLAIPEPSATPEALSSTEPDKSFAGSKAFRMEYSPQTPRQTIYDEVTTYLAEYRLQAAETFYELAFTEGDDGWHTRDLHRGVSLVDMAKNSIPLAGNKLSRRHAELEALEKEDTFIAQEDGGLFIQASPPGENQSEDGSYGFIFVGNIRQTEDGTKSIHKVAIRINSTSLQDYNAALSEITGELVTHSTPEEFITDSRFLGNTVSYVDIQAVLQRTFNFRPSALERRRNESIMDEVAPYIYYLIDMIQNNEDRHTAFGFLEGIENKVLALKRAWRDEGLAERFDNTPPSDLGQRQIDDFIRRYGYKPPTTGGSCGPTDSGEDAATTKSGVSFAAAEESGFQTPGEDRYGSLRFKCPKGHENTRPRGKLLSHCQVCRASVRC